MENPYTAFQKHFPEAAWEYVFALWQKNNFHFKISRKRQTKLGDYRFSSEKGHQITVNENLNPYAFLITYLHEVAHYQVQITYQRRKAPHGREWKKAFAGLMQPMLKPEVFPEEILTALQAYIQNPKASSCSDVNLLKALRLQDLEPAGTTLEELPAGSIFTFNERTFRKIQKRRTRILCEDLGNGKKYLIAVVAFVM
jgi:SprT protein